MKGGKKTAMPHADKKRGKNEPGRFRIPGFDIPVERPAREFPTLERDGVRVQFPPGWNAHGKPAGWGIEVLVPVADALARVDNSLAYAIGRNNTADLWDDINPAHCRGGWCMLQLCCGANTIRKFIHQAVKNGFKTADDGGENTNRGNT